jgi:hypothetical protein
VVGGARVALDVGGLCAAGEAELLGSSGQVVVGLGLLDPV